MGSELEDFITVKEAAKECGRTMETVRRWVWSGKVEAHKLGNILYIRKTYLAAYLSSAKKINKVRLLAVIEEAWKVQESIRKRIGGDIDIIEALDRFREGHP